MIVILYTTQTWNFRRVKNGQLYDYTIKQYQDQVVADNFKVHLMLMLCDSMDKTEILL